MAHFVKTDTILDKILAHKVEEVARSKVENPLSELKDFISPASPSLVDDVFAALRRDTVTLIAEIKKASPSKGILIENFNPVTLGRTYAQNGAAAISVLTDAHFFMGALEYLFDVRQVLGFGSGIPILRKDFIVDTYQVYESRAWKADMLLLIVAALADGQLAELHNLTGDLGMAALVEVHNEAEMERALKIGAKLIGINNRDLKTFHVDLETTARLAKLVPPEVTLVAESGLDSADDVRRMGDLGAHAVLIGEALVKSGSIAEKVRELSSQPRQSVPSGD
jgi:indole-3-glycerol phosphate synthase